MNNKLKTCPFCGGASTMVHLEYKAPGLNLWYAECTNCEAQTTPAETEEEALKKWNQRKQTANEDFFDWLACSAILESDWNTNPEFYKEMICRKLVRMGVLYLEEDKYVLPEPKRKDDDDGEH